MGIYGIVLLRPIFNGLSEITLRIYDSKGGLLFEEVWSRKEMILRIQGAFPFRMGWVKHDSVSSPYYIYTINGKTIDDEDIFRDGTFIILR